MEDKPAILEDEVTFPGSGLIVHGTLTRPNDDARHPAILLIAGSGPTDRNWENPLIPGANGSARLLAKGLAEQGVVVLRYDKLATGKTGMPPGAFGWDDYAIEQRAGLQLLREHAAVDPTRVFVAGHSEGGAHALRLVAGGEDVAGVLLLSTAGRTLGDIIVWQIDNQLRNGGVTEDGVMLHHNQLKSAFADIASGKEIDATKASPYPGVQQLVKGLMEPVARSFAVELLGFDPQAAFTKFDVPVLILSGAKDIQVDPDFDATPLAKAAKAAGRDTVFHLSLNADHVLKHETRPMAELDATAGLAYNAEGRDLAEDVIPTIAAFVSQPQ